MFLFFALFPSLREWCCAVHYCVHVENVVEPKKYYFMGAITFFLHLNCLNRKRKVTFA